MRTAIDLDKTKTHLALALEVVHHDRWLLGGLRDGRLRVIAQSPPLAPGADQNGGVQPIYQELSQLARRCLYERHPLAVTSMIENPIPDHDWEAGWPALIYAPVGLPKNRPVGIIILGSRTEHWYTQDEIDYVAAIGVTLTAVVSCVTGPLGRLTPGERRIALLMAEGFSDPEIATALGRDLATVARVADTILRKLAIRSRREVRDLVPGLSAAARPHLL